jgi:hypothetical protein
MISQMDPKFKVEGLSGSFLLMVCLGSLAGGFLFASVAYRIGYHNFAKGLFLGSLLSPLHLWGLQNMTRHILSAGQARGQGLFRIYHVFRWFLFVLIAGVLLTLSVFCLLGALVSYTWFLLVLAWAGLKAAAPPPKTPLRGI